MEMKKYIEIVEAFGKGEKSNLDTELMAKAPKSFREKSGEVLGALGALAGFVVGSYKGFTFFDATDFVSLLKNIFLAGPIGLLLGGFLGMGPGYLFGIGSKSYKKREHLRKEKVFNIY